MSKLELAQKLAERGFYVFPIKPDAKTPMIQGWQRIASRNATHINNWWQDGPDCNIGIFTGSFWPDEALLVIDVDTKKGKDGNETLIALELQGLELPTTLEAVTPTGGRHLYYRVPQAVRQGVNILGIGVDIRSRGGYVLAPGSAIGGKAYRWSIHHEIERAPQWVVDRCGQGRDRSEAERNLAPAIELDSERAVSRTIRYLGDEAPRAVEGAGGDDVTFRVACRIKDFGIGEAMALDLMWLHWNEHCSPPWGFSDLREKVAHAYRYGREAPGAADPAAVFEPVAAATEPTPQELNPYEKLNKEFAFVLAGGGSHILWETRDAFGRHEVVHLDESAFHKKFASKKVTIGKKSVPLTHDWMEWEGRRSYDGLVFAPNKPKSIIVE